MENIIEFINDFKKLHIKEITDSFLSGNCYYFAIILKERFSTGSIMYNQIDNHFAFKFNNKLYDITGEIPQQGFIDWNLYKEIEPADSYRVIRDCILKLK